MFLRRFHEEVSSIQNRISALVWYVKINRIVCFCLVYILFNFLLLTTLRNNSNGLVIGLVGLVILYTVIVIFKKKSPCIRYETNVKATERSKNDHSLLTISNRLQTVCIVGVFCFLRILSFSIKENRGISYVESFTGKYNCFLVQTVEDPNISLSRTTYYTTILSDSNEDVGLPPMKVLIRLPNFPRYGVGDVLKICGTLNEPENFDDFDYKKFLKNKGVYGILEAGSVVYVKKEKSIRVYLYDFKKNLINILEKYMIEPQVSLLAGILLGEDRVFSEEFEKYVRNSGTSHIVAASGYNITILILMVDKVFQFLDKKKRNILSLLIIWSFCLMSGLSASITRASIMGSLTLIGKLFGRYQSIHRSLVIGIWLFIFFSPVIIFDVGFQLSILATVGLIYLSPSIENFLDKKKINEGSMFKEYTLTTISCTLSTLPVSISSFGTFSLIGILANTLILPVLESTMLWGFLGLIFRVISKSISKIFFAVSFVQLKYFEVVVTRLGSLEFLIFEVTGNIKVFLSIGVGIVLLIFVIKEFPVENESFNYYFRLARGEND